MVEKTSKAQELFDLVIKELRELYYSEPRQEFDAQVSNLFSTLDRAGLNVTREAA